MKNEQTNIYKSKNKLFSTIFYDSAEDAPHLTEWVRKMKGEREREKETDGEICTLCESFLHTQKKKIRKKKRNTNDVSENERT